MTAASRTLTFLCRRTSVVSSSILGAVAATRHNDMIDQADIASRRRLDRKPGGPSQREPHASDGWHVMQAKSWR